MSDPCPHEQAVMSADRDGSWTTALRTHVADCETCAAASSVGGWMKRFSALSERQHALPDPSVVWLKAQLMRAPLDAARASRPLNVIQMMAYFAVAAGWAAMLTWKWNAVMTLLSRLTPAGLVASAARAETLSISFFATLLVLGSVTVMVALHTIIAEE